MLKALTMTTMNYQGKGSKKTNNIKGAISTKHCCECKCLKPSCLLVLLIVVSTYSPSLMYDISCHSVEGFHPHESLTLQYASLMTGKKKKAFRGRQYCSGTYCNASNMVKTGRYQRKPKGTDVSKLEKGIYS